MDTITIIVLLLVLFVALLAGLWIWSNRQVEKIEDARMHEEDCYERKDMPSMWNLHSRWMLCMSQLRV